MQNIRFSISTKLLILMTIIIASPIIYLIYSTITIEAKDKLNNSYQAQLTEVKFANEKLLTTLNPSLNTIRSIGSINISKMTKEEFSNEIRTILQNQKEIKIISINEIPLIKDEKINQVFENYNNNEEYKIAINNAYIDNYPLILKKESIIIDSVIVNKINYISVSIMDYNYDKYNTKVLSYTALIEMTAFSKEFNYLVQIFNKKGKLIYTSDYENSTVNVDNSPLFIKANKNLNNIKYSSLEYEYGKTKYIGSYLKSGNGIIVSVSQPMVKVYSYLYQLIQKIVIIGLITIFISLIIMRLLSSMYIINPINRLVEATSKVGTGNFDIKIENTSNDEVGLLAKSFNNMSKEIKILVNDKIDKIQMENEINIAATVQKTLFPETLINHEKFTISSFHTPASACGGDLWNYFYHNNKLYIMIADATGHGLPSALITVAAKSVFSIIKTLLESNKIENVSAKEILKIANSSIFESSKGSINMTMFVAIINFDTNQIEYSNAGHNSPWLVSKRTNSIHSLSSQGVRLGQYSTLEDSLIEEDTIKYEQNDKIFLYTDGITEGSSETNEPFGKKRLRDSLLTNIDNKPIFHIMKSFVNFSNKKSNYEDDITIVVLGL